MLTTKFSRHCIKYVSLRLYSIKFDKSIIDYRQMPDVFYHRRKRTLPIKIFTALVNVKDSFDDAVSKFVMTVQFRYDFTLPSLINKAMIKRVQMIRAKQKIPDDAIDELGVELCVAHLVVHLGGAVRLSGSDQWIGRIVGAKDLLPRTRAKNFRIEAIDLSGTNVMFEGLEYLPSLHNLKELHLGTTPFLDDHCLRRIGRLRRSLEYLDVSNCPMLSGKGLAALWSARSLRVLNVANNPFLEDKELVCLLLTEKIPLLQIEGVDYFAALSPQQKARIRLLLEAPHNQDGVIESTDTQGTNQIDDAADIDKKRLSSS